MRTIQHGSSNRRFRCKSAVAWATLATLFLVGLNIGRTFTKRQMQDGSVLESKSKDNRSPLQPTELPSPTTLPATHISTKAIAAPPSRGYVQPLLPKSTMDLLNRPDSMVDLSAPFAPTCSDLPVEKDSNSNYEFLEVFSRIFREKFDNLPWWLDEGGLIGSSRAGAMTNADDDFDFFLILPNQHAPCRETALGCSLEEFERYIYKFLMVFWDAGFCINKFHPDPKRFRSKGRLMYSFQLHRPQDVDPEQCFHEGKPFAHMHLGIFTSNGELETNIWAKHTTHPIDRIPLDVVLPVKRCRVGKMVGPCPNNVTQYLTVRNRGEYRKKSSDGSCLLVKQRWGLKRKKEQVAKTIKLRECGFNGLFELIKPFIDSNYTAC